MTRMYQPQTLRVRGVTLYEFYLCLDGNNLKSIFPNQSFVLNSQSIPLKITYYGIASQCMCIGM